MIISEKKTKAMIFNFTDKFQFTTRLQLKDKNVELVDQMKILGTVVKSDLSWDDNCRLLIKTVNARMQLLGGVHIFGCLITRNGASVDCVLSFCDRAILCSLAWLTLA